MPHLGIIPVVGEPTEHEITEMLVRAKERDGSATEALLPLLYDQLRALAGSYFRHANPAQTLQPTALVHEAFLKLVRGKTPDWESRAHFFAVAAMAMRQILANHAEAKRALRRGGGRPRVTLSGISTPYDQDVQIDLIDLDDALSKLAELSPEQARIVELRFLAGLDENEIAHLLDTSERTVRRKWRMARAFLACELGGEGLT